MAAILCKGRGLKRMSRSAVTVRQSGQIMTAAALLNKAEENPTDVDIDEALRGNICRCGTYQSIRRAVHLAAKYRGRRKRQAGHGLQEVRNEHRHSEDRSPKFS